MKIIWFRCQYFNNTMAWCFPLMQCGHKIYLSKRKVFRNGQEIQLTSKKYEMYRPPTANKGYILTYSQFHEKVWELFLQAMKVITISSYIYTLLGKLYKSSFQYVLYNAPCVIGYCLEMCKNRILAKYVPSRFDVI